MRVQDVMTRSVISVGPDAPLRDVARLLDEHRISGVLVVDDHGALLGVVSEADFLVEAQGGASVRRSPIARLFGRSGDPGTPGERHFASTAARAHDLAGDHDRSGCADRGRRRRDDQGADQPAPRRGRGAACRHRHPRRHGPRLCPHRRAAGGVDPRRGPGPHAVAGSDAVRGHRCRRDRHDPRQRGPAVVRGDDRADRGARARCPRRVTRTSSGRSTTPSSRTRRPARSSRSARSDFVLRASIERAEDVLAGRRMSQLPCGTPAFCADQEICPRSIRPIDDRWQKRPGSATSRSGDLDRAAAR